MPITTQMIDKRMNEILREVYESSGAFMPNMTTPDLDKYTLHHVVDKGYMAQINGSYGSVSYRITYKGRRFVEENTPQA